MSRPVTRNWPAAILAHLQERGPSTIYSLASTLGTGAPNLARHARQLVDERRVVVRPTAEVHPDGSARLMYFLPEQFEQEQLRQKAARARAIANELNRDERL